jgi:hypothetical protein
MANPIKTPSLSDGTGVTLRTLIDYTKQAVVALNNSGEEEAAHYFDCFLDYLTLDVANGKPFGFTYKSLGL